MASQLLLAGAVILGFLDAILMGPLKPLGSDTSVAGKVRRAWSERKLLVLGSFLAIVSVGVELVCA